jgi:membrane protease YdiL (CAAX protease family)
VQASVPNHWIYIITIGLPMIGILITALIFHIKDGGNLSLKSLRKSFRYNNMDKQKILYTVGLILFLLVSGGILGITAKFLADTFPNLLPQYLPLPSDPQNPGIIPKEMLGTSIVGNYAFLAAYIAVVVINVIGEEFWWRG